MMTPLNSMEYKAICVSSFIISFEVYAGVFVKLEWRWNIRTYFRL